MLLICSPATIPLAPPGSVYHHRCSRCGQNVVMAPSGQRFFKQYPGCVIVCMLCVKPADLQGKDQRLAASLDEMAGEIATAQPNTWRFRN